MSEEWIVRRGEKKSVPISTAQLSKLALAGRVKPTDRIRKVGTDHYLLARELSGLFENPTAVVNLPDQPSGPSDVPRRGIAKKAATALVAVLIAAVAVAVTFLMHDRNRPAHKPDPFAGIASNKPVSPSSEPKEPGEPKEPSPVESNFLGGGNDSTSRDNNSKQAPAKPAVSNPDDDPPVGVRRADRAVAAIPKADAPEVPAGLTSDELGMLMMASRADFPIGMTPDGHWVYKKTPGFRDFSPAEKRDLLVRQYSSQGRGSRLALYLLANEILNQSGMALSKGFDKTLAEYPAQMRSLAFTATALALSGQDVPPPFSKRFGALTQTSTNWIDRLRENAALQNELQLAIEQEYFQITLAIESDLTPAMGSTPIPATNLQINRGPGGQSLTVKYSGTQPLTNVVLLSLVKQNPNGAHSSEIPLAAIDTFNRAFGATEKQADDSQRYLQASDTYYKMPKYASKYVPTVLPGDTLDFEVGDMERGDALQGNTNTLAMFCDQGRITVRGTEEFPVLIIPRSKVTGPKPVDPTPSQALTLDRGSVTVNSSYHTTDQILIERNGVKRITREFTVDLAADTTYVISLVHHNTASPAKLTITADNNPRMANVRETANSVSEEVKVKGSTVTIRCQCPLSKVCDFTLRIRPK